MKNRPTSFSLILKVSLGILLLVTLAAIVLFTIAQRQLPSLSTLLNENQAPIHVQITSPEPQASYPAHASITIQAEVWSEEPIARMELWVDGTPLSTPPDVSGDGVPQRAAWTWTPGSEGTYTLVVKATDVDGATALSSSLRIPITAPVGAQLLLPVPEGEDPSTAARAAGYEPEEVSVLEPLAGSSSQAYVIVDIPPMEQDDTSAPGSETLPALEGVPAQPFSRLQEMLFVLQSGTVVSPPALDPPVLAARVDDCDVILSFHSDEDAEGVVIYRLGTGATPPDRIAYFYARPEEVQELRLENVYGAATYYAAAVAPGAEASGDPVSIDIADPACAPPDSNGMHVESGFLLLPVAADRVYLYFSRSDGIWDRYPSAPQTFLTSETNAYEITPLLQSMGSGSTQTAWTLEVWGWVGGAPENLGRLLLTPGSTELYVCGHTGECREGLGWTTQALIADDEEDRLREFQWSSSASTVTGGIWQVSSQPFGNGQVLSPPGLLASGYAGDFTGSGAQSFWIDFSSFDPAAGSAVIEPGTPESEPTWLLEQLHQVEPSPIRWADALTQETPYYVRVIPMSGDVPAGPASPDAVVYLGPAHEQENPLVEPPPKLPDIYTVQIDSFETLSAPYLPWGCVLIESIDESAVRSTPYGQIMLPYLQDAMEAGAPFCPSVYSGQGSPGPLESFVDFATSALTWVSEFYEQIKNEIVDIVANVINAAIPGLCEGSAEEGSTCHQLLKRGLEAGLMALGIPPELPNAEQLINNGRAYIISELAEELGPECGEYCQEKLNEALDEVIELMNEQQLAQACGNVELAHANGREPLCLPPGVQAVPHPGSSWQPAVVNVTITRPTGGEEVATGDLSSYRLNLSTSAVNEDLAGRTLYVTTSLCYNDYSMFECNQQPLTIEEAPRAGLFTGTFATVPPLSPGESISIPFYLSPQEYYLPGHLELIEAVHGGSMYDDWWVFYYGAELTIRAEIECPDIQYLEYQTYPWQVCGQGDVRQYTMPNSMWR